MTILAVGAASPSLLLLLVSSVAVGGLPYSNTIRRGTLAVSGPGVAESVLSVVVGHC